MTTSGSTPWPPTGQPSTGPWPTSRTGRWPCAGDRARTAGSSAPGGRWPPCSTTRRAGPGTRTCTATWSRPTWPRATTVVGGRSTVGDCTPMRWRPTASTRPTSATRSRTGPGSRGLGAAAVMSSTPSRPSSGALFSGRQADIAADLAGRRSRAAARAAWAVTRPDKGPVAHPEARRAVWRVRGQRGRGARDPVRATGPDRDRRPSTSGRSPWGWSGGGPPPSTAATPWPHGVTAWRPGPRRTRCGGPWTAGSGPTTGPGSASVGGGRPISSPQLIYCGRSGHGPGRDPGSRQGEGARAVQDYRRRFEVRDESAALGVVALSALPTRRLAAHLDTVRQVDEARHHLGRPPWRLLDPLDLGRDRA